jgi:hypothetical protein
MATPHLLHAAYDLRVGDSTAFRMLREHSRRIPGIEINALAPG